MKIDEFINMIDKDAEINGVSINTSELSMVVSYGGEQIKLSTNAILNHEWDDLRSAIIKEKSPVPLSHITRVVGYFSSVANWNESKRGELEDRHKGDYKA